MDVKCHFCRLCKPQHNKETQKHRAMWATAQCLELKIRKSKFRLTNHSSHFLTYSFTVHIEYFNKTVKKRIFKYFLSFQILLPSFHLDSYIEQKHTNIEQNFLVRINRIIDKQSHKTMMLVFHRISWHKSLALCFVSLAYLFISLIF